MTAECKSRCVPQRVAVLHTAVTVINAQQVIKVYYKNGLFMEILRRLLKPKLLLVVQLAA